MSIEAQGRWHDVERRVQTVCRLAEQRRRLTASIADLDTGLTDVDGDNFTHDDSLELCELQSLPT